MADEKKRAAVSEVEELLRDLPLFASLKPRIWSLLVEGYRPEVVPKGAVFVRQGEYTGEFCVVLSGKVAVSRLETSGEVRVLGELGPGDWFGEMSALSNQPAMATVAAATPCTLIVLDPPLFKVLYKGGGSFAERIDEHYRERALAVHLRAAPLFKGLGEDALRELQAKVSFEKHKDGATIATQGEEAAAFYLVRSGAVKCVRESPGRGARILSYHMDNSSFGERCLARGDRAWPGSYVAMAPTDVVTISRDVVEETFAGSPETLEALRTAASLMVADEAGMQTGVFDAASELGRLGERGELSGEMLRRTMVEHHSIKGGEPLVIDLKKCTRCNACVESCVAVHEDRVPRLSKSGWRTSAAEDEATAAVWADQVLASACYNCQIPECMMACNDGAIRRDVQGQIKFVWDNCTGCSACTVKCPYGVIRMTPPPGEERPGARRSLFEGVPLLGRLFGAKEPAREEPEDDPAAAGGPGGKKVKGKAVKCDLCEGLPFEACVYNCPCGAIRRVAPERLFQSEALGR